MDIASHIEHTILSPFTTEEQVNKLCEEVKLHQFAGACVPPYYVPAAAKWLADSMAKVVTVVGFPLGYSAISSKVEEAKRAASDGADEIDMVINLAAVKNKQWAFVQNDIDSVTRATHLNGKVMKVILETALLSVDEIKQLCDICMELGVNYVKTSTGFNGKGAQLEDVQLLKQSIAGSNLKIKASGGIKTKEFALNLIHAGASRLGTSSSLAIIGQKTEI